MQGTGHGRAQRALRVTGRHEAFRKHQSTDSEICSYLLDGRLGLDGAFFLDEDSVVRPGLLHISSEAVIPAPYQVRDELQQESSS